MKKLLRFLIFMGTVAGILWMLRDKLMPPQQPPMSHPPSFRSQPETQATATMEDTPEPDDLTRVKGIGPVYSERLGTIGITSFSQLAAADSEAIAAKLEIAESEATSWVTQAAELT